MYPTQLMFLHVHHSSQLKSLQIGTLKLTTVDCRPFAQKVSRRLNAIFCSCNLPSITQCSPHFWGLLKGSKRQSLHNLTREEQVMTPSTWVKGCLTMFGILNIWWVCIKAETCRYNIQTCSISFIMQISYAPLSILGVHQVEFGLI